jgi:hypothetical protein
MKGDHIKYQAGYKYQLAETYVVQTKLRPPKEINHSFLQLTVGGLLTVKSGYAWDGPSGPTIDTSDFMRGSLVHDGFYQLMREGLLPESYREQADSELKCICLEDGMWDFRADYVYHAVRGFGSSSAALAPDPIITAP